MESVTEVEGDIRSTGLPEGSNPSIPTILFRRIMKRSEAVKLFGDLLPDHLTVKECHGDRYQVASFLLDKLISKQVIQPTCKYEKIDDCMNCHNGHINVWEPEE